MITTSEVAPSPFLAPFVRCYTYGEFDTKGLDLIKPWHASHEISMPFFFKALPVKLIDPQPGEILKKAIMEVLLDCDAIQWRNDV
ncbi:hypothetical protein [Segetibacter koreensis]|uniref:hypothetical protein n=1 Tax=Segetibacter koreensis TaxID=398037 RepID=UPI000366BB5D|nr:hypothetical protein [Segetibacter koreensis]